MMSTNILYFKRFSIEKWTKDQERTTDLLNVLETVSCRYIKDLIFYFES